MNSETYQSKLAAIFYADVAGYSRLTGRDEVGTHRQLSSYLDKITATIATYNGTVVHFAGDAILADFVTVGDALACAVTVQQTLVERNALLSEENKVQFRIGINLGDVIIDRGDIYGNGVNVAARLESLAEPGGICISDAARLAVGTKLPLDYEYMGEQAVKNITEPVRAYRVRIPADVTMPAASGVKPVNTKQAGRRPWLGFISAAVSIVLLAGFFLLYQPKPVPQTVKASIPDKISAPAESNAIAILPFDNISNDLDQEYFSDGLTYDLITDISRISGLFVIARNSVFAYKGKSVDIQRIGQELNVQYVLEGSVRKAGDRVRINVQLVDVGKNIPIWANRYDRQLTDIFALQDELTEAIVSALSLTLTSQDQNRLSETDTVSVDAYDMLLRGLELFNRFTRQDNTEARIYFDKARALDSNYARAYANIALTHGLDVVFRWTDDPRESIRLGLTIAEEALALDNTIPQIYFTRSTLFLAQRQHDAAVAAARRAIQVDANYADGYGMLAQAASYAGMLDESLEAIQIGKRLNPRYSFVYVWIEAHIKFLMGRYEETIPLLQNALERNPEFDAAHLLLAATYGQLGVVEQAEWEVVEILTLRPDFSLAEERQQAIYKRTQDLDRYIEGLRKAGLPE